VSKPAVCAYCGGGGVDIDDDAYPTPTGRRVLLHEHCLEAYVASKQTKAAEVLPQDGAPPDGGPPPGDPLPRPNGSPAPDDPFNIEALRIVPAVRVRSTPRRVQKRQRDFTIVPNTWIERLRSSGCSSIHTVFVALHLLYEDFRNYGKPFPLPNGMLRYDGTSRQSKWRALNELEQLGLITIERRPKRSPRITILVRAENMPHR
jgi:hypothetical protein